MKSLSFYVPTREAGEAAIRAFPVPSSVKSANVAFAWADEYFGDKS